MGSTDSATVTTVSEVLTYETIDIKIYQEAARC